MFCHMTQYCYILHIVFYYVLFVAYFGFCTLHYFISANFILNIYCILYVMYHILHTRYTICAVYIVYAIYNMYYITIYIYIYIYRYAYVYTLHSIYYII